MDLKNINDIISKKSGIATILIGLLWQLSKTDPDNAVWYALGMVISGVTYMMFDFYKKSKNGKELK